MTLVPEHASDGTARPVAGDKGSPAAQEGGFVINLCSVAAPITIPQPRAPQLTRFRFFFSHCWEDSRRRYRLHMGYFPTAAEAQKWLAVLRKIYPSAFVSAAPVVQPDLLSSTEILRILQQPGVGVDGLELRADTMAKPVAAAIEPVQPLRAAPLTSPVERRDAKGGATTKQAGSALQKSLDALRTSEFDMRNDDELNSTGVRHLQVEVQSDRPVRRKSQSSASRAWRRS